MNRQAGEFIQTQALPLRIRVYRESDLILTLLTLDHGKVSVLARGARRSRKRFSGATGMYTLSAVELLLRPQSNLSQMRKATPVKSYARLSQDPQLMGRAAYFCELVDVLTREFDPTPGLLELLDQALSLLGDPACNLGALLRGFEINVLSQLGLWSEHDRCSLCGTRLPKDHAFFRPAAPGPCCDGCGAVELDREVVRWLKVSPLQHSATHALNRSRSAQIGSMTWANIRRLNTRRLRSVDFLKALEKNPQEPTRG